MRQFNRYLWTGLVAVFAAACGDDVTVTNPPEVVPPTPGITAVSVAPDGATIAVNAKLGMTAAATLQPGAAAPTWAWASSSTAVATVAGTTASAEVTGVAPGSAGIRATATSGTSSASGVATVTVTAAPACVINGVSISPSQATIATGETVSAAATVSATNCAAADIGVTYASSNEAVATVSATGVVTARAKGSATITATSSKDATKKAAFSLTVVEPSKATISINSVCVPGFFGGGECSPADLNLLGGIVTVRANLDRQGQPVTGVDLLVDGAVVYSQAFASASAGVESMEGEASAVEVINMPWNTAFFNATTGAVRHLNGAHTVQVRVNTTGQVGSASPTLNVTTANANFIATNLTVVNGSSVASPNDGLLWQTGDLQVTALPVVYSAATFTINSITLTGCTVAGEVLTAAPWTYTWPKDAANDGFEGGSAGIETAACDIVANSVMDNQPGPNGLSNQIRFDNAGPGAPTFAANPNGRRNGWINSTVLLTSGSNASATSNRWLVNGAADAGVGGYTRMLRIGAPSTTGTISTVRSLTPSATPTLPAPSATGTTYCAIASAMDALGNESPLPASTTACGAPGAGYNAAYGLSHIRFGVDVNAPTLAFKATGLAANDSIFGVSIGAEFDLAVVDTGLVGNSGVETPLLGTVTRRAPTGTTTVATQCYAGSYSGVTNTCNEAALSPTPAAGTVTTNVMAAGTAIGYYTFSAVAVDAAGNRSASVTRTIAFDLATEVPTLTAALFNTPLNAAPAVFNALASDNFDLRYAQYEMNYGAFAYPVLLPQVALNTFNVAPFVRSNVAAGISVDGFMRQLQPVATNSPLTVVATYKPSSLVGYVKDMAGLVSLNATTAIAAGQVTTGTDYTAAAASSLIRSFAITAPSAAVTVCRGVATVLTCPTASKTTSRTITAVVAGPTGTFASPFARLDFYAVRGGKLVLIGSVTSPTSGADDGSPFGRSFTYSFTWSNIGSAFPAGVTTIHAIGVSASGDGLVSLANANITLE